MNDFMIDFYFMVKNYLAPGQMIYELGYVKNSGWEFFLAVKEEEKYIKRHNNPIIEMRTGLYEINRVFVMPIMAMVNNDEEMLYETMFNYHQPSGGEKYLNALLKQETIKIVFYNEKGREVRRISVKNFRKDLLGLIADTLRKTKPWKMEDFDAAKEKLYENFPSPMDLWVAMGEEMKRR